MKIKRAVLGLAVFVFVSRLAFAGEPLPPPPAHDINWLAIATIVFVDLVFVAFVALVSLTLRSDSRWSLAAALAENIHFPPAGTSAAPALGAAGLKDPAAPATPAAAASTAEPQIEPSASRLIAFIGMLAVVTVFVGMANCVLWHCFNGELSANNGTEILKFLAGGSALFVPYAVNQFRAAFEAFGVAPKKTTP